MANIATRITSAPKSLSTSARKKRGKYTPSTISVHRAGKEVGIPGQWRHRLRLLKAKDSPFRIAVQDQLDQNRLVWIDECHFLRMKDIESQCFATWVAKSNVVRKPGRSHA